MTENRTKNRGWVKNVAIVFLAVLLVLTFFSETIMNRSLPEVATAYVESGTITAQIRGSGTVEANEVYEVSIKESRVVQSVAVKSGQQVAAGDVLFVLTGGDSAELETARDELESLQLQYERALISAGQYDYARENRNIDRAREALEEATEERDALSFDEAEYNAAKEAALIAQTEYNAALELQEAAQDKFESLGGLSGADNSVLASLYAQLESRKQELTEAENELETQKLLLGGYYDAVKAAAQEQIMATEGYQSLATDAEKQSFLAAKLPIYMAAVAEQSKNAEDDTRNYYTAYVTITACGKEIAALQTEVAALESEYAGLIGEDNSYYYYQYKREHDEAVAALKTAQTRLDKAGKSLEEYEKRRSEYETAQQQVETCEETLEELIYALEDAQASDSITMQLEQIELRELREQIEEQQQKVTELTTGAAGDIIYSQVDGVVKSVNITAGNTTEYDQTMATIEVPERGYSLSFAVTAEQSRKVTVGDPAEVSSYWWGSNDTTATLSGIRNDPQNPNQSKLLVFDIGGEVSSGTQLSLSIGERSRSYECIVPNSALRSDSNGDFVLMIVAKNSPLGNRYIATRVDVNVLAADDTHSAVSGGISNWDYVITTTSAPVEAGMQVRLADA